MKAAVDPWSLVCFLVLVGAGCHDLDRFESNVDAAALDLVGPAPDLDLDLNLNQEAAVDGPSTACAFGRRDAGTCQRLQPSNGFQFDWGTTQEQILTANNTWSTNGTDCSNKLGGTVTNIGTAGVCLVKLRRFVINKGVTLSISGANALVVLATEEVKIDGTLDAGAKGATPGPGGAVGPKNGYGKGDGGGLHCTCTDEFQDDCGGGGAGHGGTGGKGGDEKAGCGTKSKGGKSYGGVALVPLTAGSSGASGHQESAAIPGWGGAGGGALQISCNQLIEVNGAINAGGGGGLSGTHAGGGGGSGGGILVEGAGLQGTGTLAANGGGGGGGNGSICTSAKPGEDGSAVLLPASGGAGCDGMGKGGAGGNVTSHTGLAGVGGSTIGVGGGGGGAVGRIRLNVLSTISTVQSSPTASTGPPIAL